MVAGPDVYICDKCINDAAGIVKTDATPYQPEPTPPQSRRSSPLHARCNPLEVKASLDEFVRRPRAG